jgi:uracil-DNA glycosylase
MEDTLQKIETEVKGCSACQLSAGRTNAVPGYGNSKAEIMFIGEGPGRDEDKKGEPFVGTAGKLLTKLIESIGLTREDVFIANVVKCRPPDNRDPFPEEIKACWPYLSRQIRAIKPKIIVTLGRHSMGRFLDDLKISEVHGQAKIYKGIWQPQQVYLPLYHPAAALYDPKKKDVLFDDFKKIPLILKKLSQPQAKNDES